MDIVRRADPGRDAQRRRRGGAVLAGLLILLSPRPAHADQPRLIYALSAEGGGTTVVYNRKNLLPVSPLVSVGVPRVTLQIDDSPAATARATAFEPGVVGAASGLAPIFGAPPGLVPAYPLYADAKYPTGAPSASVPTNGTPPLPGAGGVEAAAASATAAPDSASGRAQVGAAGPPNAPASGLQLPLPASWRPSVSGLFSELAGILERSGYGAARTAEPNETMVAVDTASVSARAVRSGTALRARIQSTMGNVELLGGLVRIGRMLTTATLDWSSPSVPANPSFTSSVAEVSVLGVPAVIDGAGIHLQQGAVPAPASEEVTKAFAERGVTFGPGIVTAGQGAAEGSALRFAFEGQVQPGETDTLIVEFGRAALSFFSVFGEGGPSAEGSVAPASAAPGATAPGRSTASPAPSPSRKVTAALVPAVGPAPGGPGDGTERFESMATVRDGTARPRRDRQGPVP